MKLIVSLKVRYPDGAKSENRPYGTTNIEDCYEQTVEVESESDAKEVTLRVIKAFNLLQP